MDADTNIINRLKYALLMVESCADDPVLEARMLLKMKKAYEEEGIEMPPKIRLFYMNEIKKVSVKLKEKMLKLNSLKETLKKREN